MLSKTIGAPVDGIVAEGDDAYAGIAAAVRGAEYDEIMLSILSGPGSGWLHEGLPARVDALGIPLTVVMADAVAT